MPIYFLFTIALFIRQMHPWFRGIDWVNIHRYAAPYCPELLNPEDTRHFDADIPPEVRVLHTVFFFLRLRVVSCPLLPVSALRRTV
jgi:hypothetical protein